MSVLSPAGGAATGPPPAPPLFVYGTLRFAEIVSALLGWSPLMAPAAVNGWRAAALPGRIYPGLVAARGGRCTGMCLSGLSPTDLALLDRFEGDPYQLGELPLVGGGTAVAYLWRDLADVQPWEWDPDLFAARHLVAYVEYCHALRPMLMARPPR